MDVKVGSNVSDARKMEEVAPAKLGYDIYHCVITYNIKYRPPRRL